jgi:putative DNA primase/helicase
MKPANPDEIRAFFEDALKDRIKNLRGNELTALCPFHDDRSPSFSANIEKGVWKCHAGCGEGGLIEFADLMRIPRDKIPGWEISTNGKNVSNHNGHTEKPKPGLGRIVAEYNYRDENGKVLFQTLRYDPKDFRQRKPDGNGGWNWGLGDSRRVLYRLPEILKAIKEGRTIYIVEGERDAETLTERGPESTTNPMGAGKWSEDYSNSLNGADVVIIPDNDKSGEDHVRLVARSLQGKAARIRIFEIPGPSKDAAEWFEAGGKALALLTLADNAPDWSEEWAARWIPQWRSKLRQKLKSVSKLLEEPEPETQWDIEGIWTAKSRGFIAGNPGVGKTWIALEMGLSYVTGKPFLGKFAVKNLGPCLLLEEEMSERGIQRRIHKLARSLNIKPADIAEKFHLITRAFTKIEQQEREIISLCKELRIKLIIFDSFRRFHNADENKSHEIQPALEALARIGIETEASIVLIHHLKKGDNRGKSIFEMMRGSSDFWAWRDCIMGVEEAEGENSARITIQLRDEESPPPFVVNRLSDPDTGGIRSEAVGIEETTEGQDKIQAIKSYMVASKRPLSKRDIVEGVGGKGQTMYAILRSLEASKDIKRDGSGWIWSGQ